jgi:hypothetical protein
MVTKKIIKKWKLEHYGKTVFFNCIFPKPFSKIEIGQKKCPKSKIRKHFGKKKFTK